MVIDQQKLLTELKKLADRKDIRLPDQISRKKEYFRKKLSERSGTEFDKKFIRMITIDHKRDIRMFKRAVKSEDTDISAFAKQYLPLIQSHLDQIDRISGKSDR